MHGKCFNGAKDRMPVRTSTVPKQQLFLRELIPISQFK